MALLFCVGPWHNGPPQKRVNTQASSFGTLPQHSAGNWPSQAGDCASRASAATTGNKSALLQLLSGRSALRIIQDLAVPMYGLQLGLYPPSCERGLLPVRTTDELIADADLWQIVKPNAVYCGNGCVRLALRRTAWANDYRTGKDGGNFEVMLRYGLKFLEQGTAAVVTQLSFWTARCW